LAILRDADAVQALGLPGVQSCRPTGNEGRKGTIGFALTISSLFWRW